MASFPLTWCLLPFQLVTSRSILHIMEGTEESLFAKCLVPLKEKHLLCCVYYLCRNWFLLYFLLFFNVTISCLLSFPPEISSARQKTRKQHHCMKYLISLFCELMGKNSYFKKKGGGIKFVTDFYWKSFLKCSSEEPPVMLSHHMHLRQFPKTSSNLTLPVGLQTWTYSAHLY